MRKLFIALAIIAVSLAALYALKNVQFKTPVEADTVIQNKEQPMHANEKTVDTVLATANEHKAKKIALLIAVQNYPAISCWGTLHSLNDVQLLQKALKKSGFSVKTLTEKAATHQGIINAMNDLKSECAPGDMVWIHFSGHGQQMPDVMGDEKDDHKTEAFIPFDALKDSTHDYHGENHLTDDEINEYLIPIRNKLTKTGQLLVTIDACHSESGTRGGHNELNGADTLIKRGTTKPFELGKRIDRINKLENAANGIEISACRSTESNYEYKNEYGSYGSLSYLLYLGIKKQGEKLDFQQLAEFVTSKKNYKPIMPYQTPTSRNIK